MNKLKRKEPNFNPVGERNGRLVVLSVRGVGPERQFFVGCDCGAKKWIRGYNFHATRSCGDFGCRPHQNFHRTHGLSRHPAYRRCYSLWTRLKQIRCREWDDFETFRLQVGELVPGMHLCRLDRSQPHSQANSYWSARQDYAEKYAIQYQGQTYNLKQLAKVVGCSWQRISQLVQEGRLEAWLRGERKKAGPKGPWKNRKKAGS